MINRTLTRGSRLFRRLRRDESGAALVEFSLVFGLFVFILYALVAFGMMLALKQSLTNASTEAARAAVGITDDALAIDKAMATVEQRLGWMGSNYEAGDTTATIGTCAGGSGRCITVKIAYPYEDRPLVPPAPGLGLVTPQTFGSTAIVQIS
ncbi:MAG: TadE/TadG family type IV pilus assembly protein [Acidimicrobiales bacterium]